MKEIAPRKVATPKLVMTKKEEITLPKMVATRKRHITGKITLIIL